MENQMYNQPTPRLNMGQAIRSVLNQYATFKGRARRSEYWWWSLAYGIAYVAAFTLDVCLGLGNESGMGVLSGILFLAVFIPGIAVLVRRLHDVGHSGWWILISLIPFFGGIVILIFCIQDSQPGDNEYGPSPKYGGNEVNYTV